MGKTYVRVKVENYEDIARQEDVRSLEVEAMVDTGATTLCLPVGLVRELGLAPRRARKVKTSRGVDEITSYSPVQLTVLDRQCVVEVFGLPDNVQPLLGYLPLEWLDLQIDPKAGRLIKNPEHGEELILDLL